MKYYLLSLGVLISMLTTACDKDEPDIVNGFSVTSTTLSEEQSGDLSTLLIRLNGVIDNPVSVNVELREQKARFGVDLEPYSGELTFGPEDLEQRLPIVLIDDTDLELNESFDLIFTYAGQEWVFPILIVDNDEMPAANRDAEGFISPESYPSMELVWQEEFDGTTLNAANWTYELGNGCDKGLCGWGNNELQVYTNEVSNLKLENGRMTITARNENNSYTSARIITQDKVEVRYGRIDIRAIMPKGQGIWPALWMLGANINDVSWPMCGEIDIMEIVGHQPATTHGTVHYDDGGYKYSSGSSNLLSGDFSDEFHLYSIVWDRDVIQWYIDNKLFKTFKKGNIATYPFNQEFFFIMNVAIGGNWPGDPDGSTVFPQEMIVDYVRVFQ